MSFELITSERRLNEVLAEHQGEQFVAVNSAQAQVSDVDSGGDSSATPSPTSEGGEGGDGGDGGDGADGGDGGDGGEFPDGDFTLNPGICAGFCELEINDDGELVNTGEGEYIPPSLSFKPDDSGGREPPITIVPPPEFIVEEPPEEETPPGEEQACQGLACYSRRTLGKLLFSGLLPRNPDAAGRGMALYSTLLTDTLFERLPLRQFDPVEVVEEVVEEVIPEPEVQEEVPVRALWSKNDVVSDQAAQRALDQAIAQAEADFMLASSALEEEQITLEWNDTTYLENPSLANQWAQRDGVRAWVRGFGGNTRSDTDLIVYNDFSVSAGGVVAGADVNLTDEFQLGAFVNYGSIDLDHHGVTGGGGWDPDGLGGGLTAEYWAPNFYLQGLVGWTWFDGTQERHILEIIDDWGGDTARGSKSARTFTGAVRLGAPFRWGSVVLEPQAQIVRTQNQESRFSETSGTRKELRLKYHSRTTDFLESELGMKLSIPINGGDRALWVPSVRVAWLADWDQNNEAQTIGYTFSDQKIDIPSNLDTEHGALVEIGLDYTVQNFDDVSIKLYGRGGMEFWGSERGTTWRASGGVTFQF